MTASHELFQVPGQRCCRCIYYISFVFLEMKYVFFINFQTRPSWGLSNSDFISTWACQHPVLLLWDLRDLTIRRLIEYGNGLLTGQTTWSVDLIFASLQKLSYCYHSNTNGDFIAIWIRFWIPCPCMLPTSVPTIAFDDWKQAKRKKQIMCSFAQSLSNYGLYSTGDEVYLRYGKRGFGRNNCSTRRPFLTRARVSSGLRLYLVTCRLHALH